MEMNEFIKKENIKSLTPGIKNLYINNEFILLGMLERWFLSLIHLQIISNTGDILLNNFVFGILF